MGMCSGCGWVSYIEFLILTLKTSIKMAAVLRIQSDENFGIGSVNWHSRKGAGEASWVRH